MTTIVATLDAMAADQRVTEDGAPHYPATKIFRVGNSLFGTAGHGDMCLVMLEWLKTAQRSRLALYKMWADYDRDQLTLLELRAEPKGGVLYRWSGWGIPEKINKPQFAVGSGAFAALTALQKGSDLVDAVKAAIGLDCYSGEPIQIEHLKLKSRRK